MTVSCSGCGYRLTGEPGQTVVCEYCGSPTTFEGVRQEPQQSFNQISGANNNQDVSRAGKRTPPRPRLSVGLAVLMLFIPGGIIGIVIYAIFTKHKQNEWDNIYGRK